MLKKTLLVEIGTEELPPKSLRKLAESFSKNFIEELNKATLSYSNIKWFATPRRLALKIINLASSQPDRKIEKRGPSIIQAFDKKGNFSNEAKRWAHSCGITIDQIEYLTTNKGKWLVYSSYIKGDKTEKLLPNIVETSLTKLPIPKLMRWGTNNVEFVRPVHNVTLLLDDQVISTKILGIQSDCVIHGHRFMGIAKLTLDHADHYPKILLEYGKVIADYEQRKNIIKNDIAKIAYEIGGNVQLSDLLIEEVTSLVEWPVVLRAKFEEKFLTIPEEILIHVIKGNQKYFPVYSNNGKLMSDFIFVANIQSKNPQKIIAGNEKVIHARLSDARFFLNIDRKKRLEDYLPLLEKVLFQKKLGTMRDKTDRIQLLVKWIAWKINANVNHAIRAGLLAKCDLMTNMVFEFTDIQGIIGMHYARYDGEEENVAIALNEQYYPRFSGDKLPSNLVSCAIAIADKIDTIVGIFGINQYPNGDKDPFALRRSALGILRIIIEKKLDLDLQTLIEKSVYFYGDKLINVNIVNKVIKFILNRFRTWYRDKQYSIDVIQAVLSCQPTCPIDFDARVKALSNFYKKKEALSLIVMNKRISNILEQSNEILNEKIHTSLLKEEAEIKLARNFFLLYDKIQFYLSNRYYEEILNEFVTLHKLVEEFFKNVVVNVNDKNIRINRLTLLLKLRKLFLRVADISLLKNPCN